VGALSRWLLRDLGNFGVFILTAQGNTALIFASQRGHKAVVECLLAAAADVNKRDVVSITSIRCHPIV
jgi:ankyrin repeat protein